MLTIRDLEKACANYKLTDLLKEISDEELIRLMDLIMRDDIIGIRINICDAIYNEMDYRNDESLAFHEFMRGSK